ncbi:hypothetical protein [Nostoc sp.]
MKRVSKALHENVLGTGIFTQHWLNLSYPLTALSTFKAGEVALATDIH